MPKKIELFGNFKFMKISNFRILEFMKIQQFFAQNRSFLTIFAIWPFRFDPPSRLVAEKIPGRRLFFQVRTP